MAFNLIQIYVIYEFIEGAVYFFQIRMKILIRLD